MEGVCRLFSGKKHKRYPFFITIINTSSLIIVLNLNIIVYCFDALGEISQHQTMPDFEYLFMLHKVTVRKPPDLIIKASTRHTSGSIPIPEQFEKEVFGLTRLNRLGCELNLAE